MSDQGKGEDNPHMIKINTALDASLDDSFNVEIPEFSGNQKGMLAIFMLLQLLVTSLTVSVNPVINNMSEAYLKSKTNENLKPLFSGLTVVACILGFFPSVIVIDKLGPRFGLTACLGVACIGSALCCLIG
jgi:MFS family permease